jgi:hypothetical protein
VAGENGLKNGPIENGPIQWSRRRFLVPREFTQGGHVGNKIWGIDATWGKNSKLQKMRYLNF